MGIQIVNTKYLLFTFVLLFTSAVYAEALPTSISFKNEPICSVAAKLAALDSKQVYCNSAEHDKSVVTLSYADSNPSLEKYSKLLKVVLFEQGMGMVPSGVENLYLIERQRDLKDMHIPVYKTVGEVPEDMGLYTLILSLKHFRAEEASRIFRNMMPPNTRIISDDANNNVLITATGMHLRAMAKMMSITDTPASAAAQKSMMTKKAKLPKTEVSH
jgi:hypothetical protein